MTLSEGSIISEGNWEVKTNSDGILVLAISINAEQDISIEWPIEDLTNERLEFTVPGTDYQLVLEKKCDTEVCSEAYIADVIQNCKWKITNADGSFFQELKIDFSNMNIHVYNNETVVDEGNWQIDGLLLKFNDLSMTLANYIGEWTVIECGDGFFKIKRGEEIIILTKICN